MCNVLVSVGTEMQVPVLYGAVFTFYHLVLLMIFIKDPLGNEILSCSL